MAPRTRPGSALGPTWTDTRTEAAEKFAASVLVGQGSRPEDLSTVSDVATKVYSQPISPLALGGQVCPDTGPPTRKGEAGASGAGPDSQQQTGQKVIYSDFDADPPVQDVPDVPTGLQCGAHW